MFYKQVSSVVLALIDSSNNMLVPRGVFIANKVFTLSNFVIFVKKNLYSKTVA